MKREELRDRYRGDLKTSEEWMNESFVKDWQVLVADPDGWDRANLDYSWHEEKISVDEFLTRLFRSTCRSSGGKFFSFSLDD